MGHRSWDSRSIIEQRDAELLLADYGKESRFLTRRIPWSMVLCGFHFLFVVLNSFLLVFLLLKASEKEHGVHLPSERESSVHGG